MKSKIDFLKEEMALQKARESLIKLRLVPSKARFEFLKSLFTTPVFFAALILSVIIYYIDPLNFFYQFLGSLTSLIISLISLMFFMLFIIVGLGATFKVKKWMVAHQLDVKWMLSLEKKHGEELMQDLWSQYGRSRAAEQLQNVKKYFESFKTNLGKRFNTEEITYNRYLNTAYDIYLRVQDNISEVIDFTLDQQKTDIKSLKSSIETEKNSNKNSNKTAILEDRLKVYESNEKYIEKMLDENDLAIRKLKESSNKLEG